MDTEVYVYCPKCKSIVKSTGSGDLRDTINCKNCESFITAKTIGFFRPLGLGEEERKLYFPEDF